MNKKIFLASNFKYTPFQNFEKGDLQYLNSYGIEVVKEVKEADIIISQNVKHIKPYIWRGIFGVKFLIWTNEPRFNTDMVSKVTKYLGLFTYHVMNIYTGDVFTSNTAFHCKRFKKALDSISKPYALNNKKIVALMSYYKGLNTEPVIRNQDNLDLISIRTQIALEGHKLNVLDVYGKGWPQGISKEDSRDGDWSTKKKALLAPYNFNLCFENTSSYNYMTEKIWDSIENCCLPIYYAKHTNAYTLFEEDSFIDYSKFNSPSLLFNFIENMTEDTFVKRMNSCIETYNILVERGEEFKKEERQRMLHAIVSKISNL